MVPNDTEYFSRALDYASGSTNRNGAILDCADYNGLRVIITCATLTGSFIARIHHSDEYSTTGDSLVNPDVFLFESVPGSFDNGIVILDIKPGAGMGRYIQLRLEKSGTTAESALYQLYSSNVVPAPVKALNVDALVDYNIYTDYAGTDA